MAMLYTYPIDRDCALPSEYDLTVSLGGWTSQRILYIVYIGGG
jgi:hypothetical protein